MADVRITYQSWGGHYNDKLWVMIDNKKEEALDYHTKKTLIKDAKKSGLSYEVIRHHKDGTTSVVEEG